jgi:hypothetical protein
MPKYSWEERTVVIDGSARVYVDKWCWDFTVPTRHKAGK